MQDLVAPLVELAREVVMVAGVSMVWEEAVLGVMEGRVASSDQEEALTEVV